MQPENAGKKVLYRYFRKFTNVKFYAIFSDFVNFVVLPSFSFLICIFVTIYFLILNKYSFFIPNFLFVISYSFS
jgi:hypothetical protein